MSKLLLILITLFLLSAVFISPSAAVGITQVDYFSLTGTGLITFDDVAGGTAPGTNYDNIFESDGADFGERFLGQTLTTSGDFDQLSGSPSGSLSLVAGAPNQNLNVFIEGSSQVLTGLGPTGFPNFNSIGEGSFAVLFDFDQSEFGFQLVGGNNGSAFVDFFARDGSLIDSITVAGLSTDYYGFVRDGGINDIAGISIWNDDLAGIGFDNLIHDVPGEPNGVPEPASMLLLGIGLCGIAGFNRRKIKK